MDTKHTETGELARRENLPPTSRPAMTYKAAHRNVPGNSVGRQGRNLHGCMGDPDHHIPATAADPTGPPPHRRGGDVAQTPPNMPGAGVAAPRIATKVMMLCLTKDPLTSAEPLKRPPRAHRHIHGR